MFNLQHSRGERHPPALLSFFLEFSPPFLRIDIPISTRQHIAMKLFDQTHQACRANPVVGKG